MDKIAAFVGHSFLENDREVVRKFTDFFDRVRDMGVGFTWDHAEAAEAKELSQKVVEKMNGKNLFIGICTAKEKTISPEKLRRLPLIRQISCARGTEFSLKTSDWIIQEIGFAVGRKMEIMVLLEEGIRTPGGIQGDKEYITFNRNKPEECFIKILEVIKALRPAKSVEESLQSAKLAGPVGESEFHPERQVSEPKPIEQWNREDYDSALFGAIFEGDQVIENDVFEKYLKTEQGRDEYEQVNWQAMRLFYHYILKKEDVLQKLIELSKKNPSHDGVSYLLGRVYSDYEEYGKASDFFKQSAANARSANEKFNGVCQAAIALAKHGDKSSTELLLQEAKSISNSVDDWEGVFLKTMIKIAEIQHDDDGFLAFSECLLDKLPYEHEHRFSLAYKYLQLSESELSVYHCKILSRQKPTELVWNNLGVGQGMLGLPSKSVHAYRESEKLGGTLAMSNLAQVLINAGFLDNAEEICNRAIKIENYDKRIGEMIARIKELPQEEDKKEIEAIEITKGRRSFYAAYARACLKSSVPDVEGMWRGLDCDLNLMIKNGKMEATGRVQKKKTEGFAPPGATISAPAYGVRYNGEVFGFGIRYKHWVLETESAASQRTDPTSEGLMFISDDLKEIKVYERRSRDKEKFYELRVIDAIG